MTITYADGINAALKILRYKRLVSGIADKNSQLFGMSLNRNNTMQCLMPANKDASPEGTQRQCLRLAPTVALNKTAAAYDGDGAAGHSGK
ncbi:MAG: hypothetical protein PHQ43_05240 [Dehalococcoidales bacterium]|nr:hypothetical protein [Dehalococcoidales bacterium]